MAAEVEHLTVGPRTKRVQRMGPWSLAPVVSPLPQEASRRWCTHCGPEKTPQWRPGLAGPGMLCNVCAHPLKDSAAAAASWTNTLFREGRLPHSNSRCRRGRPSKKRRHSSKEVDKASALDAPRATTKGRRRVTAMETTCRQAKVLAPGDLRAEKVPPVRRCTHCATEKTPKWRVGPEGPRTLCNACGLVFKKKGGCSLSTARRTAPPSRRCCTPIRTDRTRSPQQPATVGRPASLRKGSCSNRASGPASCSTRQRSSLLRQDEETLAVVGATSKANRGEAGHESMEVQQPRRERPPADRPSSSLVYHRRVPECRRKSEEETFAAIRATAKDRAARDD